MDRITSQVKLSPSMMCAGFAELSDTLTIFEKHGIDYLHIDVMDGVFVPNLMLGTEYCRQLRGLTGIPLDIHLMVVEPALKIPWFEPAPGEYVSIHAESAKHLHRAVQAVKASGAKALVALNPATPLSAVEYLMDDIDGVLLMLVNPGFAGQELIPGMLRKVGDMRAMADARGRPDFVIQADGNIGADNAPDIISAGADFLVLGSSGIFVRGQPLEEAIINMKNALKAAGESRE